MARVRSASFIAVAGGVLALAGGVGGALLVACTAFSETPASVADAAVDSTIVEDDAGNCAPGAFCDSFDDDGPLPRAWKIAQMKGAGQLAIVKGAGIDGSSALVATVAENSAEQAGYLQLDRGTNGPASYTIVIAFSARTAITGTGFILGPRFNADQGGDVGQHDMIIDFHGQAVRLDHYTPTCDGGCAVPNKDIPLDVGEWHRHVLTMRARPFNGVEYGDLVYAIDGLTVVDDKLPFSLSNPKSYGFQVGVTYSNGKAAGTVAFDDVSLQITP